MNFKKIICNSAVLSIALLLPCAPAQAGLWDYAKSALSIPVSYPKTTAVAACAALVYFKGPDVYNAAKAKVQERIDAFKNSTSAQVTTAGVLAAAGAAYYVSRNSMASTGVAGAAAYLLSLRDGRQTPQIPVPLTQSAAPTIIHNHNYYGYGYVNQANPANHLSIPSTRVHDDGTMEDTTNTQSRATGLVATALDAYSLAKMTAGQFAENNPTVAKAAQYVAGAAGVAMIATAGYQLANRFIAPSKPQLAAPMALQQTQAPITSQQALLPLEKDLVNLARQREERMKQERELKEMDRLAADLVKDLDKEEAQKQSTPPAGCTIS